MSLGQRLTRQLERAAAAARHRRDTTASAAATDAWRTQRPVYREFCRRMREAFWQSTGDRGKANSRRLCRQSIDTLLGRGRPPVNNDISARNASRSFSRKKWHLFVSQRSLRRCRTLSLVLRACRGARSTQLTVPRLQRRFGCYQTRAALPTQCRRHLCSQAAGR